MNTEIIAKRAIGSSRLFLKKHGPAILTTVGVAGFIGTTYLTGRAVLRSQEKIKNFKLRNQELMSREETSSYTRHQKARDLSEFWTRDGAIVLRDFAPAIALGSVSIFCIVASHGMMKNQAKALGAAYVALDRGYRAYRERVRQELGEEKELELYRGVKTIERYGTDGELESCEIDYSDKMPSPYARFFDWNSVNWTKTAEYNLVFLRHMQRSMNDRLHAYGYVFLNEVYEALGLERSQMGQQVGWKLNNGGDNFISFGIWDIGDDSSRAFVNGVEAVVLLDFNVDGPITID